jgi:general secretion pathway protein F
MQFNYRALNSRGKQMLGQISAEDERAALRQLQRQSLTPIEVQALDAAVDKKTVRRKASTIERVVLIQQLVTLLKAGVSLDEAVDSLADSISHPQLAHALGEIKLGIRRGVSFSESLRSSGIELPRYVHQLARAGELTGQLEKSLGRAARQWSYELKLRGELRNALIYPIILVVSGISAVGLIFAIVVPKFTKLLAKAQGDVPWLAKAVLATGQFVNENILLILLALGVGAAALGWALRDAAARQGLWDLVMRAPLIGDWLKEADIGRWASLLSTLLSSRVELTQALAMAQDAVVGSHMRHRLEQVLAAVRGGRSLADALSAAQVISATGNGLVRVGERSGELAAMLRSLAELYDESGRNRMKRFLTLLEPVAILLIGGVIGLIMTGIILAITSVNQISL